MTGVPVWNGRPLRYGMPWRATAERLTHRLVFRRRLPSEFGKMPIYVSTEGGLKYLLRRVERLDPVLLATAQRFVTPNSMVWDIGANVGLFTFASAGAGAKVLAVEADPWMVRLLQRSARANSGGRVDVLCAAVSASFGLATLHIASRSRATNYLDGFGTTQTGGDRELLIVPTIPLDTLLKHSTPHLVKVDVEGAELLVLRGAERLLSEVRPIIACEVSSDNADEVTDILRRASYRLLDAAHSCVGVDRAPYATVAVPLEVALRT